MNENENEVEEIDMEEETKQLPNKEMEPRPEKIEKVVKGKTTHRKKTVPEKLYEDFIKEDISKAASWVWEEVMVPALKDVAECSINNFVSRVLHKEGSYFYDSDSRRGRRTSSGRRDYTTHSRKIRRDRDDDDDDEVHYRRVKDDRAYNDIIFASRRDADNVLKRLLDRIDTYGTAPLSYLYRIVGEDTNYTDTDYGWSDDDLDDARVVSCSGGWKIKLPRAHFLE